MFQDYEYISEQMTDELKEFSKVRRKTIIKYLLGWFILIVGFFVLGISSIAAGGGLVSGLLAVLLVVFVASCIIFLFRTFRNFRVQFKNIIVREMVKHLIETCEFPEELPENEREREWEYSAGRKINSVQLGRSGLFFIKEGDRLYGKDRIKGKIGLTEFEFSSITLSKRVTSGRDNERYKWKEKFNGILFLADFNKSFRGYTLLRDRKIRSFRHLKRYIWLIFNRLTHGKNLPRIYLENKEFNQHFKTKASNEIEARYILTSSFMEKLVQFRKKRRNPIDVSFRHNTVAIALSSKRVFFDPSVFRRIKNGQVREVYDDLIFFFSILDDLNLNTRIWEKE